jgi:hypothetical protein
MWDTLKEFVRESKKSKSNEINPIFDNDIIAMIPW